jgi:serine/threonine-protein kinase RsbW
VAGDAWETTMAHSRANEKLIFTIHSRLDEAREVQKDILAACQHRNLCCHDFFAVKLALEEALANAIKHGNRHDAQKTVRIEARISRQCIRIVIEDQGPGFDRRCVPDPTAEENLERCSGRGILLIESYMNRVKWDRGGRRLTMEKTRTAEREQLNR